MISVPEIAGAAIDKLLELAVGVVSDVALAELRRLKATAIDRIEIKARTVRIVDKRTRPPGG